MPLHLFYLKKQLERERSLKRIRELSKLIAQLEESSRERP